MGQLLINADLVCSEPLGVQLEQGWEISGPRAKCGPTRRFQWPAEAFRKDLQTYIPPTYPDISSNISQQMLALKLLETGLASTTTDLLLFFHWKVWPSTKSDLLKVDPETY